MYKVIRELREDAQLTQTQIAKMLNVTQQAYSAYELGIRAIPMEILIKIAKIHHTSLDYLVNLTEHKDPFPPRAIKEKNKLKK